MKTKQIPFSLEMVKKIQAGEIKGTILTRDGRPARFIGEIKDTVYPLVFAREIEHITTKEFLDVYTLTGSYNAALDKHDNDIIIEIEDEQQKKECQFKPFDKVLCRDCDDEIWKANLFSHKARGLSYPYYVCGGYFYKECIPYEGNEHLIGTTDKPKED